MSFDEPVLAVQELTYSYPGASRPAVRDVTLEVSPGEFVAGFVLGGLTRGLLVGVLVALVMLPFVTLGLAHPGFVIFHAVAACLLLALLGLLGGLWARKLDQLGAMTSFIVTPLTFLGGSFYSINMLPPLWRTITLFNPVVYLISGFRWSFYDAGDVGMATSLAMTLGFLVVFLAIVAWIFRTGYRLKT